MKAGDKVNVNLNTVTSQINNRYSEYNLSLNEFNRPQVDTGVKAVIDKIIMLIMMKPGTYPTRPNMGVGLVENYRYTFMDDLGRLKDEVNTQKNIYLPEFRSVDVEFDTVDELQKNLYIYITIRKRMYVLLLDTETKTLSWLQNT